MPKSYIFLVLAIATEVIGTTALQASQQFTRLGPVLLLIVSYGLSFYFLGQALKTVPVGVAYAIWSALGIVLIAGVGYVTFGQKLDMPAMIGIAFIIVGIVIMQVFSNTTSH